MCGDCARRSGRPPSSSSVRRPVMEKRSSSAKRCVCAACRPVGTRPSRGNATDSWSRSSSAFASRGPTSAVGRRTLALAQSGAPPERLGVTFADELTHVVAPLCIVVDGVEHLEERIFAPFADALVATAALAFARAHLAGEATCGAGRAFRGTGRIRCAGVTRKNKLLTTIWRIGWQTNVGRRRLRGSEGTRFAPPPTSTFTLSNRLQPFVGAAFAVSVSLGAAAVQTITQAKSGA